MKIEYSLYRVTKVDRTIRGKGQRCMMCNSILAQCGLKAAYYLYSDKLPIIYICGSHLKELMK